MVVRKVALIQHRWDNPNLGVVALSECNLALIRRAAVGAGVALEVVGVNAGRQSSLPDGVATMDLAVSLRPLRGLVAWLRAVSALRQFDVAVDVGEGDGFASIYGAKRLMWQMFLKSAVLAAKVPLVLAPQTYGPFGGRVSVALFRSVRQRAALVASRDRESLLQGTPRRPRSSPIVVADVAFALPFDEAADRGVSGRTRVGLNISGLLWAAGPDDAYFVPGYTELVRSLAASLDAESDVEVLLVGHVGGTDAVGGETSDHFAASCLAAEMPSLIVVQPFDSPSAAKSFISTLDFFVGSRMHACIAAASSGVPLVALSYSRKFHGTFEVVGLDVSLDPSRASTAALVDEVMHRFHVRGAQQVALAQASRTGETTHREYVSRLQALLTAGGG